MRSALSWINNKSNRLGLLLGLVGLIFSFSGRSFNLGRELADPLPVALTLSQALRGGFLYLNWRGVAWHLLFILLLVFLAVGISRFWLPNGQREEIKMATVVRLAAALNIAVVAMTEVDAIVVGFWYAMAGYVSVILAGVVANQVAKIMNR